MVKKSLVLLFVALVLVVMNVLPASANTSSANVFIVHGIPGKDLALDPTLPVDIAVNGQCALTGFKFGDIAGPLALPAGTYQVAIGLANAEKPCSSSPVIQGPFAFRAGENASVVAYLNTAGAPTAGKFTFSTRNLYTSRLRVVAHHTANAPTVDVRFIRQQLVDDRLSSRRLVGVSNGMYGSVDMRPGTWDLALRPTGTHKDAVGPITLELSTNTVYLAYVVGSIQNGTITVLTKAIPLGK